MNKAILAILTIGLVVWYYGGWCAGLAVPFGLFCLLYALAINIRLSAAEIREAGSDHQVARLTRNDGESVRRLRRAERQARRQEEEIKTLRDELDVSNEELQTLRGTLGTSEERRCDMREVIHILEGRLVVSEADRRDLEDQLRSARRKLLQMPAASLESPDLRVVWSRFGKGGTPEG